MIERRYKTLSVEPNFWIQCLARNNEDTEYYKIYVENLPEDTEIISAYYDLLSQFTNLILYNLSWPIVPYGEIIPNVEIKEAKISVKSWRDKEPLL